MVWCDRPVRPNDDQRNGKGTATVKLTTITHVSVDGVMQGLGGAHEDPRDGFERGGWALPLFDDEAETFLGELFQRAEAFLFGRRTYEIFARSWGTGSWGTDQGDNPISVTLNTPFVSVPVLSNAIAFTPARVSRKVEPLTKIPRFAAPPMPPK